MKPAAWPLLAALALAAWSMITTPVAAAAPARAAAAQVMVTLRAGTPSDEAERLARDAGIELVDPCELKSLDLACAVFSIPAGRDRTAVLASLAADPRVEQAQPLFLHRVAGMPPKDPYFDLQTRTRPGGVIPLLRRGGGRGVRIAIIDTGVDLNHPDLLGQIADVRNFVGGKGANVPPEFHGTAVTGLIAAHAGNGIGIHGLAPDASIHALRACWEPSYGLGLCSSYTLAQALDYAIEVRARIVNLSLSGPNDPLLARLVERAVELGAVVFGAIGEEPGQDFPASIAAVIAVEQAYGREVQVAGQRLTVPGLQLLTTVPGGRYDFVSGPSFATAHASGVAAVMLQLHPHLTATELADWLRRLHDNTD